MKQSIVVLTAAFMAITLAFAFAPLASSEANALRNGDSITTEECVHNGNGKSTSGACSGPGKNEQTVEQTVYKCKGKFQSSPC